MFRVWPVASALTAMLLLTACPGAKPGSGNTDVPDAGGVMPGPDAGPTGDMTPPAAPVLLRTEPASPANENAPRLTGTAEPGARVRIYSAPSCSGPVAAEVTASEQGTFELTVRVADNSVTDFAATATDAAGNTSGCGAPLTYREDSTLVRATVLAGTTPPSPANQSAPQLFGTAEPGFVVRLYTTAGCTGSPVAQATADVAGAFSATVTVAENSSTTFFALASGGQGQTSACSGGLTFEEDSIAPRAPVLASTTSPASPSNDNAPRVSGTAEPGARIRLYTAAGCTGALAGQGLADASGAFSVPGTVADNRTTTFYATAADAADNSSPCATGPAYREDSTPPAAPVLTSTPASPANNNAPRFTGTAEVNAVVRLYATADCSGTAVVQGTATSTGAYSLTASVADDTVTPFSLNATDVAGNPSACTPGSTYREDSTAPAAPFLSSITDPASPSNDETPRMSGTAEPLTTVRVYRNPSCLGDGFTPLAVDAQGTFAGPVTVYVDTTTTVSAAALDAAGNLSACTLGPTYVEDSTPPLRPSMSSTPVSPANHTSPSLTLTTSPGARLRLYTAAGCAGTPFAEGVADASGNFSAVATVTDDSTTSFYVSAADEVGNTSCTLGLTYVEDSKPPTPSTVSSAPASPGNNNAPRLTATTSSYGTFKVFLNAECSGEPHFTTTLTSTTSYVFDLSVADDSSTPVYEVATDRAGNSSACSLLFTYVEDSTAPVPPTLTTTDPVSPANNNAPRVLGTSEPGATIRLFSATGPAMCAATPLAQGTADASGAFSIPVGNVPDNSGAGYYATAADVAGNVSPCTSTFLYYSEDSLAPSITNAVVRDGDSGDLSTTNDTTRVAANWSGFSDSNGIARYDFSLGTSSTVCPGTVVPTTDVGTGPAVVTGLALTEGRYYACVRAIDKAGNVSAWKLSNGYTVDLTPPTVTSTVPGNGATSADTYARLEVNFSDFVSNSGGDSTLQIHVNGQPVGGTLSCPELTTRCTFTPAAPFPHNATVTATVSTAIIDDAGNPMAAEHSWSFTVRGRIWYGPYQIASGANNPRIGIDDSTTAHAIWHTGQSYVLMHYLPNGGQWQPSQPFISSSFASPLTAPSFAVSPAGAMVGTANMGETGQPSEPYAFYSTGTQYPSPVRRGGMDTRVAISPDGKDAIVFNVWSDTTSTYIDVDEYSAGAWSWHPFRKLPLGAPDLDVAAAPDGSFMALWTEKDATTNTLSFSYSLWSPGSRWSAPAKGPTTSGSVSGPQLAFGKDGTAMLVWLEGGSVHASRYVPGTGFDAPVRIQSSTTPTRPPQVGVDANGNAIATWLETRSGTSAYDVWTNRYVAGTGWGAAERVTTPSIGLADLAVEPNGNAILVYSTYDATAAGDTVQARRYRTTTGWGSVFTLGPSKTGTLRVLDVGVNQKEDVAVIWSRYRSNTTNTVDIYATVNH